MGIWRPLDSRAYSVFRTLNVNWLNVHWKRISSAKLCRLILRQRGTAEAVLRECALNIGEDYEALIEMLGREKSTGSSGLVPVLNIRKSGSDIAGEFGSSYTGTEHLFLACMETSPEVFSHLASDLVSTYRDQMRQFWSLVSEVDEGTDPVPLQWPKWAPREFVHVEDVPEDLVEEARTIVDVLSLYSKRALLKEPAVRFALRKGPRNVDELRAGFFEYFRRLAG